jgi:hypothetical protein
MSRIGIRLLLVLLLIGLLAGALAGTARSVFVQPEKFTDIGPFGDRREAAANCDEIARHLQELAAAKLPQEQTLEVDVLDVDMGGRLEPWRHRIPEVRVMRAVTWPSIKLRYRLSAGGQVLASGEETLADMDYLERINAYPTGDSLRYEKRMLDDWFQKRLIERKPARR